MMHFLKRIDSQVLFRERLDDAIIAFDKTNMKEVLDKANIPFPEDKRRKGFENNPTFIIAFNKRNQIIGYLEYCPSWDSKDDIYISSLQIDKRYRNGFLMAKLLLGGRNDLLKQEFNRIVSAVQKNNQVAVSLYRKLGFSITEDPKSKKSLFVFADKGILENDILRRYERKIKRDIS